MTTRSLMSICHISYCDKLVLLRLNLILNYIINYDPVAFLKKMQIKAFYFQSCRIKHLTNSFHPDIGVILYK